MNNIGSVVDNAVIPIYKNDKNEHLVDARELHAFLKSKRKFADWIDRRIDKCRFEENRDYVVFHKFVKNPKGGRPVTDYALTLDAAKHIGMMEQNDQGFAIRQHFIDFEKKAQRHLRIAESQKEMIINAFIQELGPYAKFFPKRYYKCLYELLKWEWDPSIHRHSGYIGKLTNTLVYSKLAPYVWDEINKRNPYDNKKKRRKNKISQLLTDEIGKKAAKDQIDDVCLIAELFANSIPELIQLVERAYQKKFSNIEQLPLIRTRYEVIPFKERNLLKTNKKDSLPNVPS